MSKTNESFLIRHRTKLLIGLVILQILFLSGIAAASFAVSRFGKEIRIQTVPVDPRDLLYGDYVILSYEISRLDISLWKGASGSEPKQGKPVYVVLKPESAAKGAYQAVGVYPYKPEALQDEVILKGRVEYAYDRDRQIHMKYGLEKYYVPEHTGKDLEKQAGSLIAKVKVSPSGSSVLVGLEVP